VTIDSGTSSNSRARYTMVGVGTARIVFAAAGHVSLDTVTITVQTPKISFSITTARLGRRQHFSPSGTGFYISTPDNRTSPLVAAITQLNGAVDSLTTTSPTIPAGIYYSYLDAFGLATGPDTLIVSAPGYLPDTAVIVVTTPRLNSSGLPGTTTTTNPPIGVSVAVVDSAGSGHYTSDTVVVAAVSSDSDVIRPAQPFVRILKNANAVSTSINIIGPGTASITYSDSAGTGYLPVTTNTVTVTGPSLAFSNGTTRLGMRQTNGPNSAYVYAPNNVATPLVVNLVSTDPRVVTVPASVTIPAGTYYVYFPITALDTVGTIQVQATAVGYNAASTQVQVTQPRFAVSASSQVYTTAGPQTLTVYAEDANGSTHYTTEDVVVNLQSSAPSVASIDSSAITIQAGNSYSQAARWSPGQVGTAQFQASDSRAVYYQYGTATANVAVLTPPLALNWNTTSLGIGQYFTPYVQTPNNAAAPIDVTLSHAGTPRTSVLFGGLPVTDVTIPAGIYYVYFNVAGTVSGTDTLVATATSPVHTPDTAYTVVGTGRVDPLSGWPATLSLGGTDSVLVTLYARAPDQNIHPVLAATTFTLAPTANIQFVSGGANSVVITSATILADATYVQFYVKGVSQGTGTADITQANYQTYTTPTITVTP